MLAQGGKTSKKTPASHTRPVHQLLSVLVKGNLCFETPEANTTRVQRTQSPHPGACIPSCKYAVKKLISLVFPDFVMKMAPEEDPCIREMARQNTDFFGLAGASGEWGKTSVLNAKRFPAWGSRTAFVWRSGTAPVGFAGIKAVLGSVGFPRRLEIWATAFTFFVVISVFAIVTLERHSLLVCYPSFLVPDYCCNFAAFWTAPTSFISLNLDFLSAISCNVQALSLPVLASAAITQRATFSTQACRLVQLGRKVHDVFNRLDALRFYSLAFSLFFEFLEHPKPPVIQRIPRILLVIPNNFYVRYEPHKYLAIFELSQGFGKRDAIIEFGLQNLACEAYFRRS